MNQSLDKNELKAELKENVDHEIYVRGVDYYRRGKVESITVSEGEEETDLIIGGRISGTRSYKAEMVFDLEENNFYDMECSCPYGEECKHSVALGLKFIDLYAQFWENYEETKVVDLDMINFRECLIDFIEQEGATDNYIIKNNSRNVKKPGKDFVKKNIIEGEFKELVGGEYRSEKELIDELSAALSIGDMPQEVIDRLIKALENIKKKNSLIQNNRLPLLGLSESDFAPSAPVSLPAPLIKIPPKIFDPKKYKIILDYGYNFEIKVQDIYNNTVRPKNILNGKLQLTTEQKSFFEFLIKLNSLDDEEEKKIDYGELFAAIKDSGMQLFRSKFYEQEKMKFSEIAEKIKASLFFAPPANADVVLPFVKNRFVFQLDKQYSKMISYRMGKELFFGKNYVVYICKKDIHLFEMPEYLIKMIERAYKNETFYQLQGYLLKIELQEEEIINLNQIICDGKEFLDLKTNNLEDRYNIQKFDLAEPLVAVDYNSQECALEIKAIIDYGHSRLDVSEVIMYSRRGGKEGLYRRDSCDGQKYLIKIDGKNIFYALLAKEKEEGMFVNFYGNNSGFNKLLKCNRNGEKQVFDFFENHWSEMQKIAATQKYKIEFIRDEFNFVRENFQANFNVDLDADNDWLGFDVDCYCGPDQISLADLKKYAENKEEFIRIKGGKLLKITNFEELERFVLMLESFYAREQGGFEGKLYHAPELENIFTSSKYYNAKIADSFSRFIKEAQSGKPVKKIKLSVKFNKVLRDYQKEGINWFYFLRKYRFAGILADDMGLGKTLQALVLVGMEKVKGKPSVVICPKTLLYNWQNEAEKFMPELKTIVIDGSPAERRKMIKTAKNYDLIITGYALMQRDSEVYEKKKIKFNYCILDEAQFIKNHTTKNARVVKKISADYRLALTGTPLENTVSEIWSIFDFLMPGFLGSYNSFTRKFLNPIMKQNSALSLGDLRKKVSCFMLRRVKSEVLKELPPKIEQISFCHLEKEQNILYQEILANVKREIEETVEEKGFNKSRIHILAGLMKLRQVCNHPVLLLKDKNYTKYKSAKLEMFLELIDEIISNKRKVLVFSQFTKMLDILAKELDRIKIDYSFLTGESQNRQEIVREFKEEKNKRVFLISLKAGGTGLNLTEADNVIIFDPWWNPSVENQAIDRTHRIGQKNSVNVYRLITEGTIEEKIVKMQERKKFLFDNLVGESKDLFTKLTWKDIKGLFE